MMLGPFSHAQAHFDLKMEKKICAPSAVMWLALYSPGVDDFNTRNLLQTARKVVGEAESDCRKLSTASLAKPEGCVNRLIGKELAVL